MDVKTLPSFSDCVEQIESAYEYMLAYAAQGREREPEGSENGESIRYFLKELQAGIGDIAVAATKQVEALSHSAESAASLHELITQLAADARSALQVSAVVLHAPALSSQLIDNLNASAHLRCLLTTIFVLDEVLGQHHRAALAHPA